MVLVRQGDAGKLEIRRRRDLDVARIARHQPHHVPCLLGESGFIRAAAALGPERKGRGEHLPREGLRRLREPHAIAGDGRLYPRIALAGVRQLHRVRGRQRRNRCAALDRSIDRPIDGGAVHERARRIVDDDHVGRWIDCVERPRHRVLPAGAAGHQPHTAVRDRRGTRVGSRQRPAAAPRQCPTPADVRRMERCCARGSCGRRA